MAAVRGVRDRLKRPDWLAELQALLVLCLLAVGVVLVANVVSLAGRQPVVVSLPASAVDGLAGMSGGLRAGATVTADSAVEVSLAHPGATESAWYAARSLPEYVLVAVVLGLLLRLVVAARRGDPFTALTVRRLRVLGGVSAIGGFCVGLLGSLGELALTHAASARGVASATLTVSPVWLLVGGGFLAVGEIVGRGRALRAELDTVI